MAVPNDILEAVRNEWEWVDEGPADSSDKPRVLWIAVENWTRIGFTQPPDDSREAVIVDGQLILGEALAHLRSGAFASRNPRFVIFREVEPETRLRRSVIAIRRDLAPERGSDELSEANFL